MYWGRGIHYRGCTFIAGGVAYQDTCVLGQGHPLQGGVPSKLGVCIPGCICTGEGHPLQGVYSHDIKKSWGPVHYHWTQYVAQWSTLAGRHFLLYRRRQCTGSGFISWGCAYQDTCVLGV